MLSNFYFYFPFLFFFFKANLTVWTMEARAISDVLGPDEVGFMVNFSFSSFFWSGGFYGELGDKADHPFDA